MSQTVRLVATTEAIEKFFPGSREPSPGCKPGIMSAPFPVDPERCTSKFGRWLAERISTTRNDDDLSIVRVTLRHTEADLHVRELARKLSGHHSIKNAQDAEQFFRSLESWMAHQRNIIAAYGEHSFTPRTIQYDWPVFGSANGERIDTVEGYFDLCAKRIRALRPARVRLWNGEEPPEALQVTVDHPLNPPAEVVQLLRPAA